MVKAKDIYTSGGHLSAEQLSQLGFITLASDQLARGVETIREVLQSVGDEFKIPLSADKKLRELEVLLQEWVDDVEVTA